MLCGMMARSLSLARTCSIFMTIETAVCLDADTANAVVDGRPQDLDESSACGHLAIQGPMIAVQRRGRGISLLDL